MVHAQIFSQEVYRILALDDCIRNILLYCLSEVRPLSLFLVDL